VPLGQSARQTTADARADRARSSSHPPFAAPSTKTSNCHSLGPGDFITLNINDARDELDDTEDGRNKDRVPRIPKIHLKL
jgi:hypothetical protein